MAVGRENEAKVRLIAEKLEKAANREQVDAKKVKVLAGERAGRKFLRGKQYMKDRLDFWDNYARESGAYTLVEEGFAILDIAPRNALTWTTAAPIIAAG